jgi:hypothetical protein
MSMLSLMCSMQSSSMSYLSFLLPRPVSESPIFQSHQDFPVFSDYLADQFSI